MELLRDSVGAVVAYITLPTVCVGTLGGYVVVWQCV